MKPNRKDLRRLKTVKSLIVKAQSAYDALGDETKEFLRDEFLDETEYCISYAEANVSRTIEELTYSKDKEDVGS